MDCLFCKIISGEIPSSKVFENDYVYAFKDINPNAPVHVLVVPKQHIKSINEANDDNIAVISEVIKAIPLIAAGLGLENGYRTAVMTGDSPYRTCTSISSAANSLPTVLNRLSNKENMSCSVK